MALTLQPIAFGHNYDNASASRMAIVATSYINDVKAEWYSDSLSETMDKAMDLAMTPDTIVYLYHTDNAGERDGLPFARISRDGLMGDPTYTTL